MLFYADGHEAHKKAASELNENIKQHTEIKIYKKYIR